MNATTAHHTVNVCILHMVLKVRNMMWTGLIKERAVGFFVE